MNQYPRIRDLREDADLTQAQVGERLGLSQRTYAYYESGQRMVPPEVLCALGGPVRRECGLSARAHRPPGDEPIKRRQCGKPPRCRFSVCRAPDYDCEGRTSSISHSPNISLRVTV